MCSRRVARRIALGTGCRNACVDAGKRQRLATKDRHCSVPLFLVRRAAGRRLEVADKQRARTAGVWCLPVREGVCRVALQAAAAVPLCIASPLATKETCVSATA